MTIRRLLVLAMIAAVPGVPGVAGAQFTTFIPPRDKVADSAKAAVVAQQKTQSDSLVRTQLTNMKTWVDSAAGITPVTASADSLSRGVRATAPETTTFRNGSRAPATASDLPLVVLIGAAALLLGKFLLGSGARTRDGA